MYKRQAFFLSDFGVRNVEIVGPQVGAQLRKQALLATAYSLAGIIGSCLRAVSYTHLHDADRPARHNEQDDDHDLRDDAHLLP